MTVFEVDPNLVRPGWTPLLVVVLLGIVLFFLGRSMIRQFGRIDVPADHESRPESVDTEGGDAETVIGEAHTPPIPDLRAPAPDGGRTGPPDQR
ncbi:MAG TPA: hypothetical protein VIT41_08255 [Microlunatus sp.]